MRSGDVAQDGGPAIIARALERRDATAVVDREGQWRYGDLVAASAAVAARLLGGAADLNEARVALAIPAGGLHVAAQWGCWRAGGVVVPLSASATVSELERLLEDVSPIVIMVPGTPRAEVTEAARLCGVPLLYLDREAIATVPEDSPPFPRVDPSRRAMVLFTSGTTSRPKGVVFTHQSLTAQVESLVEAWCWTADDRIPLFLPLHHVHAIVNVMTCCLWAGGLLEAFERFDLTTITERVIARRYTVFMAVPTIYHRLIEHIESLGDAAKGCLTAGFRDLRLMVSGSAALPASVHEHWAGLTGQSLLERYGMTETGMVLSNPYDGPRRPGAVGVPLPGVEVRLVDDAGAPVQGEGIAGEIEVRGPTVFREYWNDHDASGAAFHDGWFRTGDVAVMESGAYRILGRKSMDIIKSGGYKLSALEIEAALLEHPVIAECAVVGVPDEAWGEVVAAAVVPRVDATAAGDTDGLSLEVLRDWCRSRLSPYRIPRRLLVCDSLPRNPMGKVVKPTLVDIFTRSLAAS
ncbi:MAG: long-chain fatty acid--CoA ligase [Planctomycetia bacterium]|nr:long-chain fatty acid--CoA ligase [Planctomycetia bacterium]